MNFPRLLCWLIFCQIPVCLAGDGAEISKPLIRSAATGNIFNWSLGLLIVLSAFFFCVWAVRKLNGLAINGTEQMRIVGGLSLGMREKVILLEVGKKQLILGVTPGRIETLHVLDGEDCLNTMQTSGIGNRFSQKLTQALKGQPDA